MSNEKKNSGNFTYDCNNDSSNADIMRLHEITETDHNNMIKYFYGPLAKNPFELFMNDSRLDLTLDCNEYAIKLSFDDSTLNNDDIVPSMETYTALHEEMEKKLASSNFVYYSIQLFKGLISDRGVDKLHLRKAKESNQGPFTIVMRGFAGTAKVFHGDLTSLFPPFHGDNS